MDELAFIDRSGSNAEKYFLRKKLFGTNDVQPMWVADMDIATPRCVLDAVRERLNHPAIGYEIMSGRAYEGQIGWIQRHHEWRIQREWLSYSPSVVASIGCVIRAFSDEGDEVIVMSPVYPPFFIQVKENNRHLKLHALRQNSEGEYYFDIETLRSQITPKTKILLLCSPHNPVGRVWLRDELLSLGTLCLEHGITIVSDEIHCDLVYEGYTHIPIASLSDELSECTVTFLGTGKTFNMAGFGISTVCIASAHLRTLYERERSRIHWGEGAVLSHVAFECAYRHGEPWYKKLMVHLEVNRDTLIQWAKRERIIKVNPPQGTYLAWLDCRAFGLGDRELREFFIHEAGLGLSAGLGFGREGSGFMRLNFAVSTVILEDALDRISTALRGRGYD
ncbi:MAG: PatB family C-S lyase [Campylobacterales bacterium]|nr:PatB family C-S lyase [Campylobacterales bacterium]